MSEKTILDEISEAIDAFFKWMSGESVQKEQQTQHEGISSTDEAGESPVVDKSGGTDETTEDTSEEPEDRTVESLKGSLARDRGVDRR